MNFMAETNYYENVRQKLELGPLIAPKHKKVIRLLKALWNEEEIKILSEFESADKWNSLKHLEEKTGLPRSEIKKTLEKLVKIGTISKKGTKYCLDPLIPGVFEKYFIIRKDTEENTKKVAKLYRELIKEVYPQTFYESDFRLFKPLLPIEAEEKLIEIDKSFDVQSQALPYDLVKQLIEKNDIFAVIPCQCRLIGELSGEPCEVASSDMGCFLAGLAAQLAIEQKFPGMRELKKNEAIEYLKETEKAGLVHNAVWDKGMESSMFVCNCCSCHCGALFPGKSFQFKNVQPSNFAPQINMGLCVKCETCMRKCPNDAIYHKWPNQADASDEAMVVREELCIGCGVCAANCPNDAIKMVKVRDDEPPERNSIGNKTFTELLM